MNRDLAIGLFVAVVLAAPTVPAFSELRPAGGPEHSGR